MTENQIVHIQRPVFPPPGERQQLPEVVNVGGQLYQIVPVHHQKQSTPWQYAALFGAAGLFSGSVVLLVTTNQPIAPPAEPIVVERHVPVPTTVKPHCIMFCGSDN